MAEVTDNSGLSLLQTLGGMPMGAATGVPSVMSQAGGMPMIPGMPQAGGGMGLLASLLSGGIQQPGRGVGGIDPRAIRMLLFQQMNKPAQGPFSAIANPIVAALMARSIGPQIAQQQQRQQDMERMKTILDAMRVGSGITRDQATTALNRAKTAGAEAEAEVVSQVPLEKRVAGYEAKNFITPKPGEIIRGQQGERNIKLREEGLKLQEENIALRKRQEKWNEQMDIANYGQRGAFEQGRREDVKAGREQKGEHFNLSETRKDWEHMEKMRQQEGEVASRNINAAETLKVQRERIAAMGGSPEVKEARLNLINAQVDRTKQLMQQEQGRDPATVDTLNNLFKMAKEMSRDKAEEFLEKNAAPLVAKLSGGKIKIPYNSWNVFSLGWEYDDVNAPLGSGVSGGGSSATMPTPTPGRPGTVVAPNPAASTIIPSGMTTPPPGTILPGNPNAPTNFDDIFQQVR